MTGILGEAEATAGQMAAYLLSVNPVPQVAVTAEELCRLFLEQAAKEGVRGDALFAQSLKETGNFNFRGTVRPGQNNFAGLGTTDADTPGASFPDAATGILAQAQHAKAYATREPLSLPCADPRYRLVAGGRNAGAAPHWEDLGGKWAVPGYDTRKYVSLSAADASRDSYGHQIVRILEKILDMPGGKEKEEVRAMRKKTRYQRKSRAYMAGAEIAVKGCMIHSYGCPQPDPNVLAERWDSPAYSACVHAHIGRDEVIVTLPCEEEKGKAVRGWHSGAGAKGSANNTHLSAEMTEPSTIKYAGGSKWIELADGTNTRAHVMATYRNAVELFACWCGLHGLDPLADGVIISHSEGHRRGIASGHSDVEHLWNRFGLTMAQFRQDIKAAMSGGATVQAPAQPAGVADTSAQTVKPLSGMLAVMYAGEDGLNIRRAPDYNAQVLAVARVGEGFEVTGISADEKWYRLADGRFVSAIPSYVKFIATAEQKQSTAGTGYYRVRKSWDRPKTQIGAFKDKENAVSLAENNPGYKVFDPAGKEVAV